MADLLTVDSAAAFLARALSLAAEEAGLDLLSPLCDADCAELDSLCEAARTYAVAFGDDGVRPFYVALADAFDCQPVRSFHAVPGVDGPWLVGDGCDLWSAPCEAIARIVAAAIEPLTDSYVDEIEGPAPLAPSAPLAPLAPLARVRQWAARLLRIAPSAAQLSVSAQLQRYRGCQTGWQPIGKPRSADDAARLRDLLQRIAPSATLRVRTPA